MIFVRYCFRGCCHGEIDDDDVVCLMIDDCTVDLIRLIERKNGVGRTCPPVGKKASTRSQWNSTDRGQIDSIVTSNRAVRCD